MVKVYRLVKAKHASTAFDGEGSSLFGGRWNSKGVKMVYTSESRALAALETLVHIDRKIPFQWVMIECRIPEELIETLSPKKLPGDWKSEPAGLASKLTGDQWIKTQSSVALKIPSILIPTEFNLVLNPLHKDFSQVKIQKPEPFAFDLRFLSS